MAHFTRPAKPEKPQKPRPDFPLFAHSNGYWAIKRHGRQFYFTRWALDPEGKTAEKQWEKRRQDIEAGRIRRTERRYRLTVARLCDHFIAAKEGQRGAGDITPRTYAEYFSACEFVVKYFGRHRLVSDLDATDFQGLRAKLAKLYGVHRLAKEIQLARMIFKFGYDADLLDQPVRYGPTFRKPANRIMRAHRQQKGERMFEAAEIRRLYYAAKQPLKSMILLAVNAGYGNHDLGTLPWRALDLEHGWISHPRPKTAVTRKSPLWEETINSLREALATRPKTKHPEHNDLVFVTKYGLPWSKETSANPISHEFRKLLVDLGLYRAGRGFYSMRHVFQTIGDEARDPVATRFLMGHADPSMGGVYRERISDERLLAVVNTIHRWLFPRPTVEKE